MNDGVSAPVELRLSERDIPSFIETGVILQVPISSPPNIIIPNNLPNRCSTRYGRLKDKARFFKIAKNRLIAKNKKLNKVTISINKRVKKNIKKLENVDNDITAYQKRFGKTNNLHSGFYKFKGMYFDASGVRTTKEKATNS